jgi:hypothetical protein
MEEDSILFKLNVKIGSRSEELLVHGYDQPELLCEQFAHKHSLSSNALNALLEGVNKCIENIAKSIETSPVFSSPKSQKVESSLNTTVKQPHIANGARCNSYKHKICTNEPNPAVKILENASSKKKRCRLLTSLASPSKEIYTFHPEISKK